MNKNFVVLTVDQIIQVLSSSECLFDMLLIIVVIDGIVDGRLDAFALIELLHLWP